MFPEFPALVFLSASFLSALPFIWLARCVRPRAHARHATARARPCARPTARVKGPQGDPGAPGEVTTALGGTSANTNAINQLGLTVSDPPTKTELQAVANKLDELIAALRR